MISTVLSLLLLAAPARDLPPLPEFEAFLDGWITHALEESAVPGASLAVVRDGAVVVAKGYGDGGQPDDRPVDAETLFRIGSVTKVLTWMAVEQLADEGLVDLDADVNTYLEGSGVTVPATFEAPITLRHLMTHSPGFEDRVIGLFGRDEASLSPLAERLAAELPGRVRPPGEVPSYSNHGTALAALVVERVRGVPWVEVIEERILSPLGMTGATVRQPVPDELAAHLSDGFDESAESIGFEYVPLAPAGAASVSATAMGRWMLALLQSGRVGDARVLSDEAGAALLTPLVSPFDGADAMCHGLFEMSRPGVRIVGHGGDTLAFHSVMALFPDHGFGLAFSVNGAGGAGMREDLLDAVCERWFPADDPEKLVPSEEPAALAKYAGHYRANRYSHSSYTKLAALFTTEVKVTEDGALETSSGKRYVRVDGDVFREEEGDLALGFRTDGAGTVTHFQRGDLPILAWEKVPWRESMPAQAGLAGTALAVFLLTVLLPPVLWLLRRMLKAPPRDPSTPRLPRFTRVVGWLTAFVFLAFVGVVAIALADPQEAAYGTPPLLDAGLWIPIAAAALTGVLALCLLVAALRKSGTLYGRIRLLLLTLLAIGFGWQLWLWNLLEVERAERLWERLAG